MLLLVWVAGSIVVWEHDLAERRRANAEWARLQAQRGNGAGRAGFARASARAGARPFQIPEQDATEFVDHVFEAEDCVICQEAFGEAETGYTLPCGHRGFHRECLADWVSISGNSRCPICRQSADTTTQWLQTVF